MQIKLFLLEYEKGVTYFKLTLLFIQYNKFI